MEVINSIADLRELARRRIPRAIFEYADRGSYDELTLARNRRDLLAIEFRQRVMRDLSTLSVASTLVGQPVTMPLAIAPPGSPACSTVMGRSTARGPRPPSASRSA